MSIEKAYLNFDTKDKNKIITDFDNFLNTIKLRLNKVAFGQP